MATQAAQGTATGDTNDWSSFRAVRLHSGKTLEDIDHLFERDEKKTEETRPFNEVHWLFLKPKPEFDPTSRDVLFNLAAEYAVVIREEEEGLALLPYRIVVQLKDDAKKEIEEIVGPFYHDHDKLCFAENLYEVLVALDSDVEKLARKIHASDDVIFANPVYLRYVRPCEDDGAPFTVPPESLQWHLKNEGEEPFPRCVEGADIDAEAAWSRRVQKTRVDGRGIKIAIIDSGFAFPAENLSSNILNGGYFHVQNGRVSFTQVAAGGWPEHFRNPHGSRCADLAVGPLDTSRTKFRGIAPKAKVIPIAAGCGNILDQTTIARSIAVAVNSGCEKSARGLSKADIISCSLGPTGRPWRLEKVLRLAIDYAVGAGRNKKGTAIFWAVDNVDRSIHRDEVTRCPDVITVGRSDCTDHRFRCAYGPQLDFLAPGHEIFTSDLNGEAFISGTSYATPLAAGVAALVLQVRKGLLWKRLRRILQNTCDRLPAQGPGQGRDHRHGWGRINAGRAVRQAGARLKKKQADRSQRQNRRSRRLQRRAEMAEDRAWLAERRAERAERAEQEVRERLSECRRNTETLLEVKWSELSKSSGVATGEQEPPPQRQEP